MNVRDIVSPSDYVWQAMLNIGQRDGLEAFDRLHQRMTEWARATGVRPYVHGRSGLWCLSKLLNARHRCTSCRCYAEGSIPGSFRALDHPEMWRAPDGSAFVLTAHPYGLDTLDDLIDWARPHGLLVSVQSKAWSWYGYGTYLVVVYGKEWVERHRPDLAGHVEGR